MKLSVIVPVYNAANTMERCIDSILKQSYRDFELILVDDGSTDESGAICDSYNKKDKRCKVIHKKNAGVSSPRNYGLDVCSGDYVTFVDSDDTINEDTYEKNMKLLLENGSIDILQYPTYEITQNGDKTELYCYEDCMIEGDKVFAEWYRGKDIINYCIWNKIYKRSLIGKYRFPEGKLFEDIFFNYSFMRNANKIRISGFGAYNWSYNGTSITHTKTNYRKLIMCAVDIRTQIFNTSLSYNSLNIHRLPFYLENIKMLSDLSIDSDISNFNLAIRRLSSDFLHFSDIRQYRNGGGLLN